MSKRQTDARASTPVIDDEETVGMVLEYELEAPPEKIWRALTIQEYRDRWLPGSDLAAAEPMAEVTGEQICFRMRDSDPPHLESVVTFQLTPQGNGGTVLRVTHRLIDNRLVSPMPGAANSNEPVLMQAA